MWDFLNNLLTRLDNTATRRIAREDSKYGHRYDNAVLRLYRAVEGEELFWSSIPTVTLDVYFELFPSDRESNNCLKIWRHIIVSAEDFIRYDRDWRSETGTPYAAACLLKEALQHLPFVQRVYVFGGRGNRNLPRLRFWARLEQSSCKWCADWVNSIYGTLYKEGYLNPHTEGHSQFFSDWLFTIRPLIKAEYVQRSREEHLKIWKLIELAVRELLHGERSR